MPGYKRSFEPARNTRREYIRKSKNQPPTEIKYKQNKSRAQQKKGNKQHFPKELAINQAARGKDMYTTKHLKYFDMLKHAWMEDIHTESPNDFIFTIDGCLIFISRDHLGTH